MHPPVKILQKRLRNQKLQKNNYMKKLSGVLGILVFFVSTSLFGADVTALSVYTEAIKKDTAQEGIDYVSAQLATVATNADKRSLLYFKGTLEEQLGLYDDASYSYAQAAGIAAGDAAGMQKVSSEQLVLNAVRASLCAGDFETADRYLNSAVRSSSDEIILAYINLYAQWSALCKAQSLDETDEAVSLLKAYSSMDSMTSVKPTVLLTLWYVSGEDTYASQLKKEFPSSMECGVISGKVQLMSVPFWYFFPHKGVLNNAVSEVDDTLPATTIASVSDDTSSSATSPSSGKTATGSSSNASAKNTSSKATNEASSATTSAADDSSSKDTGKITRQQCGLFREEANAKALVSQLKTKGFDAKITTEKRASGTTYYIVVVDENKDGTVGLKLRDAGFECYPVVE